MPKTNAVLPGFWGNVGLAVVFFLLTLTARPTRRRLAWRGLIAAFLLLLGIVVIVYLGAVIAGGIRRAGRGVAETWHGLRRRWESHPPAR